MDGVCPSACLSVRLSVRPFVSPTVYLSVCLSAHMPLVLIASIGKRSTLKVGRPSKSRTMTRVVIDWYAARARKQGELRNLNEK